MINMMASDIHHLRSKCACLTASGRPCSRDAMPGSDFCWQHDLTEASLYLEQLSKHPKTCYDRATYVPDYTIIFTREELERFSDFDLERLYRFYNIDEPGLTYFYEVLIGQAPWNPHNAIEQIYEDLVKKYYPHLVTSGGATLQQSAPRGRRRKPDPRDILIEGLLYYYRIVDTYGIRLDPIFEKCPSDDVSFRQLKNTVQPIVISKDDSRLDLFIQQNYKWFAEQAEQLLPFSAIIVRYINYTYETINRICREDEWINYIPVSHLIHAFNFASPLPTDIVVYRYVHILSDDYISSTGEGIEKGFMSTSLKQQTTQDLQKKLFRHYFTLYVPKGTICLNLLLYNIKEYELLFPPGTRFKIYETSTLLNRDNEEMKLYTGIMCNL